MQQNHTLLEKFVDSMKINVKETATSVLASEKMVPAPALAAKAVGVAPIATQSVG